MTSSKDEQTEREAMSLMARQVAEGSRTLGLHIKQHDDITEEARAWAQEVISEGRRLLEEAHGQATNEILQSFRAATDLLRQDAERFSSELRKQGSENAASLKETALQLAKTNEELLQRMESGIKAAEDAINSGSQSLLQQHETTLAKAASQFQALLEQQADSSRILREEQEEELRQGRQRQLEQYQQLRDESMQLMKAEMEAALEQAVKANQETLEQVTAKANQENRANTEEAIAAADRRWSRFTKAIIGAAIISSTVAVAVAATLVVLI